MMTKINVLNASEKFNDVLDLLESKGQYSLSKISQHIQLPNLDIIISPAPDEYKTDSGILGCVSTPYLIEILVDTDREDLVDVIHNELTAVIAHELHHAIRALSGVQEKTLFQTLISEGLACHFETKFNGNTTPRFLNEVKKFEWRELYNQMQTNLNNQDFNYPDYFGVGNDAKLPERAGYWVGFNLVSEYINKYGGCASTLIGIPAEKFVAI
ncbi:DUF2268 domain-containing putative Zn-dependent protease [Thalassotalea fusca]